MVFDTRLLTGVGVLAAVTEAGNFARAAGPGCRCDLSRLGRPKVCFTRIKIKGTVCWFHCLSPWGEAPPEPCRGEGRSNGVRPAASDRRGCPGRGYGGWEFRPGREDA